MELKVAKQVIAETLNIAISKGCYGLVEVQNIVAALQAVTDQPEVELGTVEKLDMRTPPIMAAE